MAAAEDGRLDPVRSFTLSSLKLEPDEWRDSLSEEESSVTVNSFCTTAEQRHLFLYRQPDGGLSASLDFPAGVRSKVICVTRTVHEAVTKNNCKNILRIREVQGGEVLSFITVFTEEVICPLLGNPETVSRWAPGVAEEALRFMEQQKNEALVMEAQMDGHIFLPQPGALSHHRHHDDGLHHDGHHDDGHHDDGLHHDGHHDDSHHHDGHHDDGHHQDDHHDDDLWVEREQSLPDPKLVHACEGTIVEWAELVYEVLQQDWSRPVLDGLKPLPSEEFIFWNNRVENLCHIQQQLESSRVQQVSSILQLSDSIYWSTLRDLYRQVQEGVQEAECVTADLSPVQVKLEELQQVEYQQLQDNMAAVMEELRLLWTRSEFYRQPCRMVVLLQEICNLFIHLSREFLRGQDVLRSLMSEPGPVLEAIRLVVWTLQTLKEVYDQNRALLEDQDQDQDQDQDSVSWDFPSYLVFFHLDAFLTHLHSIQEALCVSLQWSQLDQTVLSGVDGRMWTDVVRDIYEDFLVQVRSLSELSCDPTDPEDQSFQLHLDQFRVQMSHLETRLVSVLSRALQSCNETGSATKLLDMFGFILERPLIRDQLGPQLARLVQMVLMDLDQIELLFHSERDKSHRFCRFRPAAEAQLRWTRQVQRRTQAALKSYRTIRGLYQHCGESPLILQRFQQLLQLLQSFRVGAVKDWSSQLDSDCGFILKQPLIHQKQQGMLGVSCSRQVEAVLRELRCVLREGDVELRPHAAQFLTCRDDITQSYWSLSHMVSCYNQVLSDALPVEFPLIQDQLQRLDQTLSALQRNTWSNAGVQQQTESVLTFYSRVREARANMDAMTHTVQVWAELQLLQRSGDSLLEGGATEDTCKRIREEGEELLRLTQVNRTLYGAEGSSQSWTRYLDHIDDRVQDGLLQLLLRALHLLSDSTSPQSCSVLLSVSLRLQDTGCVFEPSVGGGLSDHLTSIISDVYAAASLPPRISVSRHGNYQASLQQNPELCALEQEVMSHVLQVKEEAEHLRVGLDRYAHLWQSDKKSVLEEFLTYGRNLGPEELEADETPPTLQDFQREIESLDRLTAEVTHLDEVIVLLGWLQVDQRPFRDSLLSIIHDWKQLYTDYLLEAVSTDSQQQAPQQGADDDEDEEASSSSSFPLTETILLLEAAAVQLPEHLAAQC